MQSELNVAVIREWKLFCEDTDQPAYVTRHIIASLLRKSIYTTTAEECTNQESHAQQTAHFALKVSTGAKWYDVQHRVAQSLRATQFIRKRVGHKRIRRAGGGWERQ